MSYYSLRRSFIPMTEMVYDLAIGRYPSYIYKREPSRMELPPVFCMHACNPIWFEKILKFLATNNYKTLDCDEYLDLLQGNSRSKPLSSVLLTFDDGLSSVWSAALPLLQKYHMKAVVFVIPGRIQDHPARTVYRNLDDVWSGKAVLTDVLARDVSNSPLCTWQELQQAQESGFLDIQCHTLWHSLVFVEDVIRDFVHPLLLSQTHRHDLSMSEDLENMSGSYMVPELGVPIYRAAPRMGEELRIIPDSSLRRLLVKYVQENGGPAFFSRKNWPSQLKELVKAHSRSPGIKVRIEEPDERKKALEEDLQTARQLLEDHLPGHSVRHLAYPWGKGSDDAINASKRAGYVSNFWGRVDNRLKNRVGQDPYRIARIGEDFIPLLPGKETSAGSLWRNVLLKKLRRRTRFNQKQKIQEQKKCMNNACNDYTDNV
jgi:peptidoglycan/xylan/chitin deacetylase (PgdA/CDA1 family)